MSHALHGVIAAAVTPFDGDSELDLPAIEPLVEHLIAQGVGGFYVTGSTGEGPSLSGDERRRVAEAYLRVVGGRRPVLVQVGHNSVREARDLARHAQEHGADAVSATCPSYFPLADVDTLVDCVAEIAAGAPDLPFYYYHIPGLTGAAVSMTRFLDRAASRIQNLAGLKYTQPTVHEYQSCLEQDGGRHEMLWGCDEMLLSALVVGARAAVGSTYNLATPAYLRILDAFQRGDLPAARREQSRVVRMVEILTAQPFHSALKHCLARQGFPVGDCRLPLRRLDLAQRADLDRALEEFDFFHWSSAPGTARA